MQKIDSIRLFEGISHIDPAFVEEANAPLERNRSNIIRLKKAGALAASFLFAAAILLSINAAFPAFAERLPLIGEVFRQLNSLGSNAPSYEGMVQNVGVSAENGQYSVTVTEAYCDGEYIFFALRLRAKDAGLLKMETLQTEGTVDGAPGWNVALNGESGGLVYTLPVFTRKGESFDSGPIKVALPEGMDSPVHVEVTIGSLSGRTEGTGGGVRQIVSDEPVRLGFDLAANTSYNRREAALNAETDGLELLGWSCSPSRLSVTLAYPYFDTAGVWASARTGDGLELGEDMREWGDFGDGRYGFGDTAVQECSFVGPPDGAGTVVVTVYKDGPLERTDGAAVFGEFTIDLESGDVSVTANYINDGFEHLSIDEYAGVRVAEEKEAAKAKVPSRSPAPETT